MTGRDRDYDGGEETTDGELPDLDTFEADWEDVENSWDDNQEDEFQQRIPSEFRNKDVSSSSSSKQHQRLWDNTQSSIIFNKSATFPRQAQKSDEVLPSSTNQIFLQGGVIVKYFRVATKIL